MHLYIIAGHGAGDPGACANGYQEAERVRALAQRIKDFGGDSVTLHDFSDDAYQSGALSWINIPDDWQVVELHMDSASAGARGAHVIIQGGFEADDYDRAIANSISAIFPGRSNIIVGRTDLANPNRAAQRGFSYRLVENGFISNAEDIAIFNSRIDDIAKAYLAAFGIGAGEAPAPTPTPPKPSTPNTGDVPAIRLRAQTTDGTVLPWTQYPDFAGWKPNGAITYLCVDCDWPIDVEAYADGRWWGELRNPNNINDKVNGCVGNGSPITGLKMYLHAPNADKVAAYQVNCGGGYYPEQRDDEIGAGMDGYAGDLVNPIYEVKARIANY